MRPIKPLKLVNVSLNVVVVLSLGVASARFSRAADDAIGRLGTDVVPVRQAIALDVDPRRTDYTGSVDVVLDVRKSVRSFRFHAEGIDILGATLVRQGRDPVSISLATTKLPGAQVSAEAQDPLTTGRYTMHVDFRRQFDTQAKGLYRLQAGGEWYAFTQFEAVDARKAFPCWDEPAFKIPFDVTVTAPAGQMALANTSEDGAEEKDGRRTVKFKTTRPLPSYLLAIAVGPFETVPMHGTSIPARVVTPKGQSALAAEAVALTPPILAALERYFDGRYPYDKLDLIAVPEYWYGAMENPGLITYVDRGLLMDQKAVDAAVRNRLAMTTAHELAHMWFGDLVTMTWWDDLWLNESFATWMEHKVTAEVFPELNSIAGEVSSAQRVMGLDSQLATRAMRQPVQSMDSLLQSADRLAYAKGAAVLHMVESWIGPDKFRAGVLAYVKEHADANATASDLWDALGKASGQDVASTLSSFLDQPGVPLVAVLPLSGRRVKLTQSRFLNAGAKAPRPQVWKIPVALRYPEGSGVTTQRVMLTRGSQVVTLGSGTTPAWIEPNSGEFGYYRWSLPAESLARLTAIARDVLDVRERIGLLGNASALLNAGKMGGTEYVKVLEASADDPAPEVVDLVLDGVAALRSSFFVDRDAELAPFVRRTLAPVLRRIGTRVAAGEPVPVTTLRPRLLETLGDVGRDDAVLSEMERLAEAYAADPSSVDPSLADVAIRLSAIRGDAAKFDLYRTRFENAADPAERKRYLAALGNFRDPALASRALDYALAGPLRPQETTSIARAQAEIPSEKARTYAWVTAHYAELAARIPADFMVFMPRFADGCSIERADAARKFFTEPSHAPPGTSKELARVEESVKDCAELNTREGESVRRYTSSSRE